MCKIAIVGATGLVGRELLKLLENCPKTFSPTVFASARSLGEKLFFRNKELTVKVFEPKKMKADIAFFCAGKKVSQEFLPQKNLTAIDLSSAFRMDPSVPLIIPFIFVFNGLKIFWFLSSTS